MVTLVTVIWIILLSSLHPLLRLLSCTPSVVRVIQGLDRVVGSIDLGYSDDSRIK